MKLYSAQRHDAAMLIGLGCLQATNLPWISFPRVAKMVK